VQIVRQLLSKPPRPFGKNIPNLKGASQGGPPGGVCGRRAGLRATLLWAGERGSCLSVATHVGLSSAPENGRSYQYRFI